MSNTSQQQHRWTLPEAVVTASDDGRKHRPKQVEQIKVNKSKHLNLFGYQL